jgi:two-component system cell cycle sensor histidine kinase/response regulator CckA
MAADLLDREQRSDVEDLNSYASVETSPMPATAFSESDQQGRPETILLVENEEFVRKAAGEVLQSAGYRMVIAGNAAEALEACRTSRQPVDLLLTDVVMPGMSGCDLALEFEGLYPHGRVLLMSGHAERVARSKLSRDGEMYLAKPFSIARLLKKVREALDKNLSDQRARA